MTLHLARRLARRVAAKYRVILSDVMAGFYLHGSMTLGGFNDGSDIDFLVVTGSEPSQTQKEAMIRLLLDLDGEAPEKGFEMSVVLLKDTLAPRHPIGYSLHFSNAHKKRAADDLSLYCSEMNGRDPDLAAHFTVAGLFGEELIGPPPGRVFAPVPRGDYIDSVISDVAGAMTDILRDPVYVTLNLCRAVAACEKGLVLSKQDGAVWGLSEMPNEYSPLIRAAAGLYLSGESGIPAGRLPISGWDGFAGYCLKRLSPYMK